jgi:hypothetical protein
LAKSATGCIKTIQSSKLTFIRLHLTSSARLAPYSFGHLRDRSSVTAAQEISQPCWIGGRPSNSVVQ